MANKLLENKIRHYKEIEKLQERIIYFTAMGSIIGCMLGGILGYTIGKEIPQKITEQKNILKPQQPQKTIAE